MAIDEATTGFLTLLASTGAKPVQEMTPQEARAFFSMIKDLIGPGPDMARAEDHTLDTPDGSRFTVRVLVPAGDVTALVVYYHGGGWVIGAIDEFDTLGRTIAARLKAAVVLVDYRLAPEHPFPAAADDAWLALRWAGQQMESIAGGRVPLAVMGDSAGGNLSAVVARRARDAGEPALAAQVLVYPVTDADTGNAAYLDPANQLMLTRDSMVWFWDHYAPDEASRRHPDASPMHAEDLTGLAPAIVVLAEHDVLREEGEAYAERLRQAGVAVTERCVEGQMHGFFTMVGLLPGSAEAIEWVAGQLGQQLGAAPPS